MKQVKAISETHLCKGCIFDKQINGGMPRCVAPLDKHKQCLEFTGKDVKIWVK